MRKTFATILAVTAVLAVACGGGAASPSPTTTTAAATSAAAKRGIKLGALVPVTGASGATGLDMKEGYELAKEQINAAGGVNGAKIEVIYEDDKNDPATAVASFEKLANNDKVEVMMGGLASTISAALIEPAKKAAIPMAWTGAAATAVEKAFVDHPFFFPSHPRDSHTPTPPRPFPRRARRSRSARRSRPGPRTSPRCSTASRPRTPRGSSSCRSRAT